MASRSAYRGCLVGMAIGDAMGYPVDTKDIGQIRQDYGPNGLMGYDLVNGYADITSHTQLAAFAGNGLLLGMTRGQVLGRMGPYVRYSHVAQREWAIGQRRYDQPSKNHCWTFLVPEFRRRHCVDTRMVEILNREKPGTLELPVNTYDNPAAIATAIPAALFANTVHLQREEADRLGAESIALTYGNPLAFLPGAVIVHLITDCLNRPEEKLETLVEEAISALDDQFGAQFRQTEQVTGLLRRAMEMAKDFSLEPVDAMESLGCDNGAQVLAGAVYAALIYERDFDSAIIVSVNHSGRSAAVGTLTGAILGAKLGEEKLPDFYLEGLEILSVICSLADDLYQGCPMGPRGGLYDVDWDRKYLHGGR